MMATLLPLSVSAKKIKKDTRSDREIWVEHLYKLSAPVLSQMAESNLQKNMLTEVSASWDGRNSKVIYMETFGRLMAGLAPWLSLPDDDTKEGEMRKQLKEWALKSYANAVDPESPDYLGWNSGGQTLVDAAYLVESFYRAFDALWMPLDSVTKQRYITELKGLRRYDPPYTNWHLFVAMEECFLMKVGADYDAYRIHMAMNKVEEWYVGDGWYSDGPAFSFDYYNCYVIQPMYVECLDMIRSKKGNDKWLCRPDGAEERYNKALKRMQKLGVIIERFVSPEGTFPVVGRSITYRMGVFQPLAQLAMIQQLPQELSNAQVRSAMTEVLKKMYETPGINNYNEKGYLTIGFMGNNLDIADWYTNNGSLYMTSLAFLPLGLPADHPYWTDPAEEWTNKKAWSGKNFPKDHKWDINRQILYWE